MENLFIVNGYNAGGLHILQEIYMNYEDAQKALQAYTRNNYDVEIKINKEPINSFFEE